MLDAIRGWWKAARAVVRRERFEAELDDEVSFHIAMETEKNVRAGMAPSEARRAALLAFRGVQRYKEQVRSARRGAWIEAIAQDVRLALRSFRRAPGVAALVVATLGLGLGATTVIFGLLNAAVLRPLPWPDPDALVEVMETTPEGAPFSASQPNFLDYRNRATASLAALGGYVRTSPTLTGAGGDPERVTGLRASRDLVTVLGGRTALGRAFTADEDRPGGDTRVVTLSHGLWQRRFGGDSAVVGRRILLDGEAHLVTGVFEAGFGFEDADLWVPLAADPASDRLDHWLTMIGRLAPDATPARAEAELEAIARSLAEAEPAMAGWGVDVVGLHEQLVGPAFRRASLVLAIAVGLLLLMACANAANLLLARALARRADLGLRAALGAGRGRLVRQLLTESVLLAGGGAVLGGSAAIWVLGLIRAAAPAAVPRVQDATVDVRVVAFATAATLATALLAGLFPALQAARTDPAAQLADSGRAGTSRRQRRLRDALVVAQVAVALVLMVGAGLLTRSFVRLQAVDPGFRAEGILRTDLRLPSARYSPADGARFFGYRDILRSVQAVPGVTGAALAFVDPFGGRNLVNDITPADRAPETSAAGFMQAGWRPVSPEYFDVLGIPLLRGRGFTAEDRYGMPPTVILTQSLAERLWPGEDPIGKGLFWGGTEGEPRRVVGVVGDIRDVALDEDPRPLIFLSYQQVTLGSMVLLARTDGATSGIAAAVREAIWRVDRDLPVDLRPLARNRADVTAGPRFNTLVLGLFAALSLALAAIGLYGLLGFTVVSRTREFGVRRALGALPGAISRMVILRGLGLTGVGIAIGLVAAVALARVMESLLFRTPGIDPVTFLAAPAVFAAASLLASWLPARRALAVDPVRSLRGD